MLAGLAAALALLLPAVVTARMDAASEENGFAGCGTFLDPAPISTPIATPDTRVPDGELMREYAATCAAAVRQQRTTVTVLAAPAAVTAALSLLHAAGALTTDRRGMPRQRRGDHDGAPRRRQHAHN